MSRCPPARKAASIASRSRVKKPVLVAHPDLDDLAAELARHGQERHVGRGGQDDRRAGPGVVRDGDLQRLDHVRDGVDRRRVDGPAVPALLEVRARRGQLAGQHRGQVAEIRVADSAASASRIGGAAPKSISATAAPNPSGPGAVHLKLPRARSVAAVVPSMVSSEAFCHVAILPLVRRARWGKLGRMAEEVLTAPRVMTGEQTVTDGAVVLGDRARGLGRAGGGAARRVRGAGRGRTTRARRSCPG